MFHHIKTILEAIFKVFVSLFLSPQKKIISLWFHHETMHSKCYHLKTNICYNLQALIILRDKNVQMVGEESGVLKKQRKQVGQQSLLYILEKGHEKIFSIYNWSCMQTKNFNYWNISRIFFWCALLLICLVVYLHTWNMDLQVFLNLN